MIDHVGLVLRYADGRVVLFEALGGSGVLLTDWKEFLANKWYEPYKKIVYRRLQCKRTPETLAAFEHFIKVTNIPF